MAGLVALVHVGISIVEMFFWKNPLVYGRLNHLFSPDVAIKAASIVANAGLYNGFIAAGLSWGLVARGNQFSIRVFFLTCVIVAGIFGTVTLETRGPLVLQTVPGTIALLLVWLSRSMAATRAIRGSPEPNRLLPIVAWRNVPIDN